MSLVDVFWGWFCSCRWSPPSPYVYATRTTQEGARTRYFLNDRDLKGKNEKQFWKQLRKFWAWFNLKHKFICLFLQSIKHTNTRVGQTNRAVQTIGLLGCLSVYVLLVYLIFCLLAAHNRFICALVLTFFQIKKGMVHCTVRYTEELGEYSNASDMRCQSNISVLGWMQVIVT